MDVRTLGNGDKSLCDSVWDIRVYIRALPNYDPRYSVEYELRRSCISRPFYGHVWDELPSFAEGRSDRRDVRVMYSNQVVDVEHRKGEIKKSPYFSHNCCSCEVSL